MNNKQLAALVLLGSRKTNKRIALFSAGLRHGGYKAFLLAFPRGDWDFSPFEDEPPNVCGWLISKWNSNKLIIPDVVICFHWIMLPVALMFKLLGARIIYDEHDDYEMNSREGAGLSRYVSPFLIKAFHTIFLPWANAVTCIHLKGGELKSKLERLSNNVIEIHNYPSSIWKKEAPSKLSNSSLCVVYIGGIWEVKGCELLVQACLHARAIGAELECHLFGDGDPHLMEDFRSKDGVVVHGQTPSRQIIDFLHTHRCVGMVLYQDTDRYRLIGTNSHKLYEYVVAGVPVIASNMGEIPDFVGSGVGWVLGNPDDENELETILTRLSADNSTWELAHEACLREVMRRDISWESEWLKIEALLSAGKK